LRWTWPVATASTVVGITMTRVCRISKGPDVGDILDSIGVTESLENHAPIEMASAIGRTDAALRSGMNLSMVPTCRADWSSFTASFVTVE
jgi:hypothetical protein